MTIETSGIDESILNQGLEDEGADEGGKQPEDKGGKAPTGADEDMLELGSDEAPKVKEGEEGGDEEGKTRSRPWSKRVDVLTARLREAEKVIEELRSGIAPGSQSQEEAPKAPNPDDYEFGAADPEYIKAAAVHEIKEERRKEREESDKADAETRAKAEVARLVNEGMANAEKIGAEKYDDFEEKIAEAIEARGGEGLHPMVGIGIAVSPAGADIAYRLATDLTTSEKIEKLAAINPQAAAIAFGELEGEYLEDESDSDLNPADPLDLARMLGRERARRRGAKPPERKAPEVKTTKAPKPPEHRARGASGQFEVSDDTDDFAAFEAKHMKKE